MVVKRSIERLLDANANRSREGLRVLEDTARFLFEDAPLAKQLRSLRHRLDQSLRELAKAWVLERAISTDPGRKNPSSAYPNLDAIWASNFKRVSEALRVLEEYTRLLSKDVTPRIQRLRFDVYKLEKRFYQKAKKKP